MSDTVKLSALIAMVSDDAFKRIYDCPLDEITAIRTRLHTLRTIAPVLVAWVAVSMEFLDMEPGEDPTGLLTRHRETWAQLKRSLTEAGVTCE